MRRVLVILLVGLAVACSTRLTNNRFGPRDFFIAPVEPAFPSRTGVVSAATREASGAGAEILARGGNAIDAAVATGFALAVTEPSMSGLGGRASVIIRQPDGTIIGVDGLNQVPRSYRQNSGLPDVYERIAIPGVPAALAHILEQYGTMPLSRVLAPAIRLARGGFVLSDGEADRWAAAQKELAAFGAGKGTYLKADGTVWKAGGRVANPMLAATLQRLADEGIDSFYRGAIADLIDQDMRAHKAFVTKDELSSYRVLPALMVRGAYRQHTIVSNFRPSAGQAVIQALHTLEQMDVPGRGDDVRWAAVVAQAMHWALTDRATRRGTEEESASFLTSLDHAADRAKRIVVPPIISRPAHEEPWQPGGLLTPPGTLITADTDREATSHFSVADDQGRVVALTQSLGPAMGTRLVAPGLGFLYATRLGTQPGSRPASTVAPTLVIGPERDGINGVIALGAAGDNRIISSVIQVISRLVDHRLSLQDAVRAPRVHPDAERTLRVEDGPVGAWSPQDRAYLTSWGFTLVPAPSGFFGRVHAVRSDRDRRAFGVAEPRWNGGASAPSVVIGRSRP